MHRLWRLIALCFGVLCCCGPSLFASDIILIHGHIYTGNPKAPWAQALAITGGRIDAVGTDQDILNRKQAKTEVIQTCGDGLLSRDFPIRILTCGSAGLDFTVSISRRPNPLLLRKMSPTKL